MSNINIGLSEDSTEKEKIVIQDENTIARYKVLGERIDIGDLRLEKASIEEILKQPTDEELLEWARQNYPVKQVNRAVLEDRLAEINKLLEIK